MTSKTICTEWVGKAVLALLLVCVLVSGIPMVEVHSHEGATFGHSHGAHEFVDDYGAEQADSEDGFADTASFHAHDVTATSLGAVAGVSVDATAPRHSHSYIPPPYSQLPDNIVAPLYRPPIA